MKVSRNELCPCNSGKKFKKCCIDKTQVEENSELDIFKEIFQLNENIVEESSIEFKKMDDWAQQYLSQLDKEHPFFDVLSDTSISHYQILQVAKKLGVKDYLEKATPLYNKWVDSSDSF